MMEAEGAEVGRIRNGSFRRRNSDGRRFKSMKAMLGNRVCTSGSNSQPDFADIQTAELPAPAVVRHFYRADRLNRPPALRESTRPQPQLGDHILGLVSLRLRMPVLARVRKPYLRTENPRRMSYDVRLAD